MVKSPWLRIDPYPAWVCICVGEKQFAKEVKGLKVPDGKFINPKSGYANTREFENHEGSTCCIVYLPEDFTDNVRGMPGVLAHELLHVQQMVYRAIGEEEPGWEASAYMMQMMMDFAWTRLGMHKRIKHVKKKDE